MSYMNVAEIEDGIAALAESYPQTSTRIELPNPTAEDRRSHALRIGPANSCAASIVIVGGIHAREWVPPDALVYFAADLLEAHSLGTGLRYGDQTLPPRRSTDLVESFGIIIFPCVNPDGRHYSQTVEPMWRKNRRKVRPDVPCVGVDVNRNFDALWDFQRHFAADSGVSASADPCHPQVYVGPEAASEPETRNVVWLIDQHPRPDGSSTFIATYRLSTTRGALTRTSPPTPTCRSGTRPSTANAAVRGTTTASSCRRTTSTSWSSSAR